MCLCGQESVKEKGKPVASCNQLVVRAKLVDLTHPRILDELLSRPNSNRLVDRAGNDLGIDLKDYRWALEFSKEKLCLV